jgi:hypothetical protein
MNSPTPLAGPRPAATHTGGGVNPAPKKKRKKPFSATARALEDLRALGFIAAVVEKRLPHCFRTKDCFGFGDILAVRPGIGVVLIQATAGDGGNHAARRSKLVALDEARVWLESGGLIEIWSYRKGGAAGKRKTYALRREEIRLDDLFPAVTVEVAPAAPGGAL